MCLNTQGEGSYKMRNAMLLKRGYLFNAAASEYSWRGLHRVRDLCSECTRKWAVSRYLFQVNWRCQSSGAWEGYSCTGQWIGGIFSFAMHAFHCDRALIKTNTWKWPEQCASSHHVWNVNHTATHSWCMWFLLVRGMMCQAACLNPLSVQLLPQAVQRKWSAKGFSAW